MTKNKFSKQIRWVMIVLTLSLLAVGSTFAQGGDDNDNPQLQLINIPPNQIDDVHIPVTNAELQILPGNMGGNPIDGFQVPENACDNAVGSYVNTGDEAIRVTIADFEDIIYDNKDEDLVYYALYFLETSLGFPTKGRFMMDYPATIQSIPNPSGLIENNDIVTIGEQSACVGNDLIALRFWQLSTGDWVLDTITILDPIDLSSYWDGVIPDNQGGMLEIAQPENPVMVDGVMYRYLMPYVEPPITAIPSANEIDAPNVVACDGTAPSYLDIGMEVEFTGYGYERMAQSLQDQMGDLIWSNWVLSDQQFALSNYGTQTYIDILNTTPLLNIPGNYEAVAMSVEELYGGVLTPTGTVIDGPVCTAIDAEPDLPPADEDCSWGTWPLEPCTGNADPNNPAPDEFTTWWYVNVNGTFGWYPENVGQYAWWVWETDGIFPRKEHLYYLVPINGNATMASTESCDDLLPSRLSINSAGYVFTALNLRDNPNGNAIDQLPANTEIIINGNSICDEGNRWQPVRTPDGRTGWVAENDRDYYYLVPGTPVREPETVTETEPEPITETEPRPESNDASGTSSTVPETTDEEPRPQDSTDDGNTATFDATVVDPADSTPPTEEPSRPPRR